MLLVSNGSDTTNWVDSFGIVNGYVVADPTASMVNSNQIGTPHFTVVDPRTMEVIQHTEGWGGDYPQSVYNLANQNKP